jgi:hypothetical protein
MILELLGSAGFGSLLGGLFNYLNKKEERATLQMNLSHEKNMVEAKTNASIKLAEMNIEQAKVTGDLAVEKTEVLGFRESLKTKSTVSEIIKSFIRPAILAVLMYQTYLIFSSLETLTGGLETLPESDVIGLYKIVILMITGVTSMAVTWYFGQRSSKQFDKLVDQMGIK